MTSTTDQPTPSTDDVPADPRDMVLVHRVFRREFDLFPGLVRSVVPGDLARAAVLRDHWALQHEFLHHHHAGEDAWLWSRLLDRSAEAAALVPRMESAHLRVDALLTTCNELVGTWAADPSSSNAALLADAVTEMQAALIAHLDDEEASILPIVRATMAHSEWSQLGEEQMKTLAEEQIPLVLGMLLEDCTTDDERNVFLSELPPPVAGLWATAWSPMYDGYTQRIRG